MYIITALPLKVIYPAHTEVPLTYFSRTRPEFGAIIHIPIRKKIVRGIVVSARPATSAKLSLKTASFIPKKIDVADDAFVLPASLFAAATNTARYYLQQRGAVLGTILLASLLPPRTQKANEVPAGTYREIFSVGNADARVRAYQDVLARATGSVWILCPTTARAKYLALSLASARPILIHSGKGKKQLRADYQTSLESRAVVIATASALGYITNRVSDIIIEDAANMHWVRTERPHIDTRILIRHVARAQQCILHWNAAHSSLALPTDLPPKKVLTFSDTATVHMVDMKKETEEKKRWTILSDALTDTLARLEGSAILYVSRKGYAPTLMCGDCGTVVRCASCAHVMALKISGERFLSCPHCKTTQHPEIRCAQCDSWNIIGYGVGVERVYEMLNALFPERPLIRFDRDAITSARKAVHAVQEFQSATRPILIGTDLINEHPSLHAQFACVVHVDNMFTYADYMVPERIWSTITNIRERSTQLMIQTHIPDDRIWQHFIGGTEDIFFSDERRGREIASLPPFTNLLRVTPPMPSERAHRIVSRFIEICTQQGVPAVITDTHLAPDEKRRAVWDIQFPADAWEKHADAIAPIVDKFPPDWTLVMNPQRDL